MPRHCGRVSKGLRFVFSKSCWKRLGVVVFMYGSPLHDCSPSSEGHFLGGTGIRDRSAYDGGPTRRPSVPMERNICPFRPRWKVRPRRIPTCRPPSASSGVPYRVRDIRSPPGKGPDTQPTGERSPMEDPVPPSEKPSHSFVPHPWLLQHGSSKTANRWGRGKGSSDVGI